MLYTEMGIILYLFIIDMQLILATNAAEIIRYFTSSIKRRHSTEGIFTLIQHIPNDTYERSLSFSHIYPLDGNSWGSSLYCINPINHQTEKRKNTSKK